MCFCLYIASDRPLPVLEWNEADPGTYVVEEANLSHPVRKFVTKRLLYGVGSHLGCGCPFRSEPNSGDPTEEDLLDRRDFDQLAIYLTSAIKLSSSLEIYGGWDYWEPPLAERSVAIKQLFVDKSAFGERELIRISRS